VPAMNFFWHFFWQIALFCGLLENPPLNINGLKDGSRGRARTYNITVNSRALYH
jgi:hypothetical protein